MIQSNTFTPFFGFVEDVKDPQKLGRVKVRVTGYHTDNKGVLPTDDLLWFMCIVNNSEADAGVGTNPKYNVGSMVFGYFIDNQLQNGFVAGAFNGIPGGENDINRLARNEEIDETIVQAKRDNLKTATTADGEEWEEPETPYDAVYPENKVTESNSGHTFEVDDTEGAERLHVYHKAGTFYEIHPDGQQVVKIVSDNYTIIAGDNYFCIEGNSKGFIGGNNDLNIKGNNRINIDGADNVTIGESQTIDVGTTQSITVGEAMTLDAKTIEMTADTITLNGEMFFNGNITHDGDQTTSGAHKANTVDSAANSLDDHGHPYTWTDPGGAGVTQPAVT